MFEAGHTERLCLKIKRQLNSVCMDRKSIVYKGIGFRYPMQVLELLLTNRGETIRLSRFSSFTPGKITPFSLSCNVDLVTINCFHSYLSGNICNSPLCSKLALLNTGFLSNVFILGLQYVCYAIASGLHCF